MNRRDRLGAILGGGVGRVVAGFEEPEEGVDGVWSGFKGGVC